MPSKNIGREIISIKEFKDRVIVCFDDEELSISLDTFSSYHLSKGLIINNKDYKEIKDTDEMYKYLAIANAYLQENIHTEKEVSDHLLKKGARKEISDRVIKLLKHYDLVCDEAFIYDYLEYSKEKGYGKNKVISYLSSKGIKEKDINNISFPEREQKKMAKSHVTEFKKKYAKLEKEKQKASIYRRLLSLGFSEEISLEVVEEL